MKRIFIYNLLFAFALCVHAQGKFIINGKVANVEDGSVFRLYRKSGRLLNPIAEDTIIDGTFRLIAQTDMKVEKLEAVLWGKKSSGMIRHIYVSPNAQISIEGDSLYIFDWNIESSLIEQKEDNRFVLAASQSYYKQERISEERNEWFKIRESSTSTNEERKKARQMTDYLLTLLRVTHNEMYKSFIDVMKDMPVSSVWMDKLYDLSIAYRYTPDFLYRNETLACFNLLTDEQKSTPVGKEIAINLLPQSKIMPGDKMIDSDLYDLDGICHRLKDLKGKYILLDFWSRGCGPCLMSIPEMNAVQEKYKDKLVIVSLSSDTEKQWREASSKHQMNWYNWNDMKQTSGLYLKYGVRGIPHYVLISPKGKIVAAWSGYGKGALFKRMDEFIK